MNYREYEILKRHSDISEELKFKIEQVIQELTNDQVEDQLLSFSNIQENIDKLKVIAEDLDKLIM